MITNSLQEIASALSNMDVWIVALCERKEAEGVTRSGIWKPMRHLGNDAWVSKTDMEC